VAKDNDDIKGDESDGLVAVSFGSARYCLSPYMSNHLADSITYLL
jgi:hypothetical protein